MLLNNDMEKDSKKKTLTISSNLKKKIDTSAISSTGKKSFSVKKKEPFKSNKTANKNNNLNFSKGNEIKKKNFARKFIEQQATKDFIKKDGKPTGKSKLKLKGPIDKRDFKLTVSRALNVEEIEIKQRSLASVKRARLKEKKTNPSNEEKKEFKKVLRNVKIPEQITIQELSNRMAEKSSDIIKFLFNMKVIATINHNIDKDTAEYIVKEFGHTPVLEDEPVLEMNQVKEKLEGDVQIRPPVVTIMGHVDHGKTSLLDALRDANVVSGEYGGITQHIGAYQVTANKNKVITFIDTPGHAAFTSMRARGAKVTDIVVLVVAADDGVMPQTIEAINHAKEAEAPIIVAINKIDKPDADPNATRNSLLQHEIVVEEMGGDIQSVELSALTKKGIDDLIEAILLQADLLELKANPDRSAEGFVIEAKLDKNRGPAVTTIIQRGTLKVGDILVIGQYSGKVRSLINDQGKVVKECLPGEPIEILGMSQTPEAGDILTVVESDSRAREVSEYRQRKSKAPTPNLTKANLDQLFSKSNQTLKKEILVVVKADVQGSSEAIKEALLNLGNEEVSCRVIHVGAGAISESDITLAEASKALVLGFNVRANNQAKDAAEKFGITILYHSIIYDLIDDVKALLEGKLDPELRSTVTGMAEVLEVFKNSKIGNIAGCNVIDGKIVKGLHAKLLRDDVVIYDGLLSTLRRFKDDAKEVNAGQECGLSFDNNQDIRPGDKIECYKVDEIKRTI